MRFMQLNPPSVKYSVGYRTEQHSGDARKRSSAKIDRTFEPFVAAAY
jgi:hypothetical protein